MSTFQISKLTDQEARRLIGELYDSLSVMKSRKHIQMVMRDLLTPNEMAMLARRIQIAILLDRGLTLRQVSETLHIGLSTVQSVKRSLSQNGEGYRLIIESVQAVVKRRKQYHKTSMKMHSSLEIWKSIFDVYNS